jgi:hypothetical protein
MPPVLRIPLFSFIILLTAFYPGYSYGQKLLEEDSLQILQYEKQSDLNLVCEILNEDKVYTDEIIDSVLNEHRNRGFGGGTVHYAPDSAFKIYIIARKDGSAYDNSIYHSYLHFKNGKRLDLGDYLEPVTGIYKTGPFSYFAIQHVYTRSGVIQSIETYTLTQFSVDKDSIQYMSIKCPDKQPLYYSDNFAISTLYSFANDGDSYMRYDPKTKRLSYRFIVGHEEAESYYQQLLPLFKNDTQALQVTGACVVKNGVLQFAGEKFKMVDGKSDLE